MPKIEWDKPGERFYETGVDRGVLYVQDNTGAYPLGVPWNGLTAVTKSPSGAEATPQYADNMKYLNLVSAEEFGATIEAFTYPTEFEECDGSAVVAPGVIVGQQRRKTFGFCYRTLIGNDIEGTDLGYKLHLVYGALAAPTEKAYNTVNDSPEAMPLSWEITTTPAAIGKVGAVDYKPSATMVIDSREVDSADLLALEEMLYGGTAVAKLPTPAEVIALLGTP